MSQNRLFDPGGLENPYLDLLRREVPPAQFPWGDQEQFEPYPGILDPLRTHASEQLHRRTLVHRFAWAIPDHAAIAMIAQLSPIVEMGAGTGYWAKLLAEAGADVVAYDINPPGSGQWSGQPEAWFDWPAQAEAWFDVGRGCPQTLRWHRDRTLFLCWPEYGSRFASDCLRHYRGTTLAYVGEHQGGCCADDAFFDTLESSWDNVVNHHIPQYAGMHDYLSIWRRRHPAGLPRPLPR